jgi:hypothetical protein
MDRLMQRTSLALLAALATLATATTANALTPADPACRAAIQKNTTKLGQVAMRSIDVCLRHEMTAPTGANCNDLNDPVIAALGKVAAFEAKLHSVVASKCDPSTHALSLAEFVPGPCPSPATNATVSSFADVSDCEADIVKGMVEMVRRYILNPDTAAIAAHPKAYNLRKCGRAIATTATKLWWKTALYRGKCQNAEDKTLPPDGDVDTCATFLDDNIAAAFFHLNNAVQSACGASSTLTTNDLFLLHSCAADAAGIQSCVSNAIRKNASGVNSTSYEFTGVCPTEVRLELNSGTRAGINPGRQSSTALDAGWTGLGHRVDVTDGFVARLNLDCSDASCSSCAVSGNCEEGNCRCSNNQTIECGHVTGPYTQDVCGAGGTCQVMFGPPLALSAGGSPICVTNAIVADLTGSADVGTGQSLTTAHDVTMVYLGISQSRPCPTCSGATIGAAGTCSGGANNGGPCVTNAIHPDFGATSYQCHPYVPTNIAGSGLKLTLDFTDGHVSLPFGDSCDAAFGALACACGVCSLDNLQTCNGDADCATLGVGVCAKGGTGTSRRPNNCDDLSCEDVGEERGACMGENDLFCDGYERKDGTGIITCATNADCVALDSECPGGVPGSCGTCTLAQAKRCFLDPIEATGTAGMDGSEVVSTFCIGPTNNAGINAASGFPGPGRIVLDWNFTAYCPNGTQYEIGGSNCSP